MWRFLVGVIALVAASPALSQSPPQEANSKFLAELRAEIKGREKEPAGKVFKNVEFLKNTPAATFLSIMDVGYSRALGVGCSYCHDERDFASEAKRPKRAAREMQLVHRAFNDQLRAMVNAESPPENRAINCGTCHRGQTKPVWP